MAALIEHSQPVRLVPWDGSDDAKAALREPFGDAVAFVKNDQEDAAVLVWIDNDHVDERRADIPGGQDEDGTLIIENRVVQEFVPPTVHRQLVRKGEYVALSDRPGPMTREQVE